MFLMKFWSTLLGTQSAAEVATYAAEFESNFGVQARVELIKSFTVLTAMITLLRTHVALVTWI